MSVFVVGDVHADWKSLNSFIGYYHPDIILQVGDFGYWPKFGQYSLDKIVNGNTKIYFCPGNHEDWTALDTLGNNEVAPNIYYMKKGSTLTLPDGRRVLFMGGALSIDKVYRTPMVTWFPQELVTAEDVADISAVGDIDIVVSHTCPTEFEMKGLQFLPKIEDPSRANLSKILTDLKPKEWYFGHWHEVQTGKHEGTSWLALNESHGPTWWKDITIRPENKPKIVRVVR